MSKADDSVLGSFLWMVVRKERTNRPALEHVEADVGLGLVGQSRPKFVHVVSLPRIASLYIRNSAN